MICDQSKAHAGGYITRPNWPKVRTNNIPGEVVYSDTCGPFSLLDVNSDGEL